LWRKLFVSVSCTASPMEALPRSNDQMVLMGTLSVKYSVLSFKLGFAGREVHGATLRIPRRDSGGGDAALVDAVHVACLLSRTDQKPFSTKSPAQRPSRKRRN
jgi:hypothetical protein